MTFQYLSVTFPSLSFPEPLPEVHNIYEASTLFIIPLILDSLDINEQHDYDCIIIFSWIKFYHEIGLYNSLSLGHECIHVSHCCHVSRVTWPAAGPRCSAAAGTRTRRRWRRWRGRRGRTSPPATCTVLYCAALYCTGHRHRAAEEHAQALRLVRLPRAVQHARVSANIFINIVKYLFCI